MPETLRFIYFADPMCPWCWGFSSTFNEIVEMYRERAEFQYVAGGLRTGDKVIDVTPDSAEYIYDHWECAMFESGQSFDLDFVEEMEFRYDTEPGCRAVVTVRRLAPGREFEFEKKLQDAFYNKRMNPTEMSTFHSIITGMGLSVNIFDDIYNEAQTTVDLQSDFDRAHLLDRKILPSLIVERGDNRILLASGYTKKDIVIERLNGFLKGVPDTSHNTDDLACDLDSEIPC